MTQSAKALAVDPDKLSLITWVSSGSQPFRAVTLYYSPQP